MSSLPETKLGHDIVQDGTREKTPDELMATLDGTAGGVADIIVEIEHTGLVPTALIKQLDEIAYGVNFDSNKYSSLRANVIDQRATETLRAKADLLKACFPGLADPDLQLLVKAAFVKRWHSGELIENGEEQEAVFLPMQAMEAEVSRLGHDGSSAVPVTNRI